MNQAISVKQFVSILNETLVFAYPEVLIEGEVQGFKINQGKWVFFDLKDEEAVLNCFMPVRSLDVPLEDGMKVRVSGYPKLTNWGKFSFTVRTVQLAGEGELRRAYELLKAKLESEGLFDPAKKRPLPKFPATIGVITSGTSAAFQDFIKIMNARWGGVRILLADVLVQGPAAPAGIVAALDYFNQRQLADTLVLIRGGGSQEDLQAFNAESVARAVAASRTPIIVGVGHETDTSLADHAADLRAATPTDAARLAVPDRREVAQMVSHYQQRFWLARRRQIADYQAKVAGWRQAAGSRLSDAIAVNLGKVETLRRVLAGFDPQATLNRGYAIVTKKGKVLKSPANANPGDSLVLQLAEGKLGAKAE